MIVNTSSRHGEDDEGTCNSYRIKPEAEMMLRKCCLYIIKGMVKMMKGTCNLYRIIAVAEKMLIKCCLYIIIGMIKMIKGTSNFYRIKRRS